MDSQNLLIKGTALMGTGTILNDNYYQLQTALSRLFSKDAAPVIGCIGHSV